MELVGTRVALREFRAEDETAVHAFASDPLVTRYTTWGPNDPEDTVEFLAHAAGEAARRPRSAYALAITRRADATLLGAAEIRIESEAHRRGSVAYVLDRHCWNHGFASEATRLLVDFGFDGLGLHRITATCHPDNAASARVLVKNGMRQEGRLRDHLLVRGVWRDSLLFAVLRPDR